MPAIGFLVDHLGRVVSLKRLESVFPMACDRLVAQNRLSGPFETRLFPGGFLGIVAGGNRLLMTLGLDEQAMQSKGLGSLVLQHLFEAFAGFLVPSGKLRRLCQQKLGRRLVVQQPVGIEAMFAREFRVARPKRNEPAGQSLIALVLAAALEKTAGDPW